MNNFDAFVGRDVQKDTITIAVADSERSGEVRVLGAIPHETAAINRMVKNLAAKPGALSFAYEAGPCGYGLHRHLIGLGHACEVVAPSRTPVQPGMRRVKNDTIDALNLARLHRAGEFTFIWTPDATNDGRVGKARR